MKFGVLILVLSMLICSFWYAPRYLTYADPPVRSVAIVVLVGSGDKAKLSTAHDLIDMQLSRHLILPSRIQFELRQTDVFLLDDEDRHPISFHCPDGHMLNLKPEKTHIELMIARKKMESQKLVSAMIVSHPFHMRRVKIIASKVFENSNISLAFVPYNHNQTTRHALAWFVNKDTLGWVLSEYVKIAWFWVYNLIPGRCYY